MKLMADIIEQSVLESIKSFKKFAMVYFAGVNVVKEMVNVLNKRDVKNMVKLDPKTKEFFKEVSGVESSEYP